MRRELRRFQLPRGAFTACACILFVLLASRGHSQTPPLNGNREIPDFTMHVSAGIVEDFNARVSAYVELRSTLESGLTARTITDDPAAIERAESALARKLRAARAGTKKGDVFTRMIEREFKKVLIVAMNARTWASVMDDNPGAFPHEVNDTYKNGRSFSTVPPGILAFLPELPDDIQYLFLGRHLILYDTRSHLIIDRMSDAIEAPRVPREERIKQLTPTP